MGSGLLNAFYRFWFRKEQATALGLVRILFAATLLVSLVYDWVDVAAFYSTDGFIPKEYVPALFREARVSVLDHISSPEAVYALYAVFIAAVFLLGIGYKAKYMKFAVFLLLLSFHERNFLILNSGDTLMRVMSFYIMLSPCEKALGIDSFGKKAKSIPMWPVRLMQLQLVMLYFFAGFAKYGTDAWMGGSAVNLIVRNGIFNRFPVDFVASFPIAMQVISWAAFAFVLAFPFLIWIDRFRKPMLIAGAVMHIGIFAFIDVGWFSLFVLAFYPLFLKPDEVGGIIDKVKAVAAATKKNIYHCIA